MNLSRLKLFSFVIGGVSMIVASELQKRETRETVEQVIAEREEARKHIPPIG